LNVFIKIKGEIGMENPIHKIQIDRVYSEERGKYRTEFHYRFEKELNMAIGEPGEVYGKVIVEYENPVSEEKLRFWHESRAPLYESVKNFTPVELSYITPISKEEYEANTRNEGEV
jgi:hypothetical protein